MTAIKKIARKPSSDPAQEKLRQMKDEWNHEVSSLIMELIAFKRGLNGRGDRNLGIPPSSIKDPLPDKIDYFISNIGSHADQIQSDARQIKDYQAQYSANRKKSKTASWAGSRWWSRISLLANQLLKRVSSAERKLRLRMLYSSQEIYKKLSDLESKLYNADKQDISQALTLLGEILISFTQSINLPFQQLKELKTEADQALNSTSTTSTAPSKPESVKETSSDSLVESKPVIQESEDLIKFKQIFDLRIAIEMVINYLLNNLDLPEAQKKKINNLNDQFKKEISLYHNVLAAPGQIDNLDNKKLLANIFEKFNALQKFLEINLSTSDFAKASKELPIKIESYWVGIQEYENLIKTAEGVLSNWLRRKMLGFGKSNADRIKIDIINLITSVRQEVNNLMDLFEDRSKSLEDLEKQFNKTKDGLMLLTERVKGLGSLIYAQTRDFKDKNINLEKDLQFLYKAQRQLEV